MAASHLSVEEFFSRLSSLFESRRKADHGSIFLTQKRLNPPDAASSSSPSTSTPSDPASFPDLNPSSPLPILIRATDGKSKEHRADKIKLSTIVDADQLEGFFVRYAEVCKGGMQGLKKRDRSKNKAKAKKRKGGGGGEGEKKS